jgi:hypothetical protein
LAIESALGMFGALGARALAIESALGMLAELGARTVGMFGALGARALAIERAPGVGLRGGVVRLVEASSALVAVIPADCARALSSSISLVSVICSARGSGTVPSGNGGRIVGLSAARCRFPGGTRLASAGVGARADARAKASTSKGGFTVGRSLSLSLSEGGASRRAPAGWPAGGVGLLGFRGGCCVMGR